MEKLAGDGPRLGDGGKAGEGVKVRRKVVSPLRCLIVTDILRISK